MIVGIVHRRHSFSKLDGNPPLRLKQQSNSATEGEKDVNEYQKEHCVGNLEETVQK